MSSRNPEDECIYFVSPIKKTQSWILCMEFFNGTASAAKSRHHHHCRRIPDRRVCARVYQYLWVNGSSANHHAATSSTAGKDTLARHGEVHETIHTGSPPISVLRLVHVTHLLYKPWPLVVPTCAARCLHQRPLVAKGGTTCAWNGR